MYERIAKYLAEQLDVSVESLSPETTFESLHLDSLDMVEMVMDMEEELNVDFDQDGNFSAESIGELAELIEKKLAGIN
ncbi:MAG: phosphopantetheine-binding protein [Oscillospiraceae bacterium]|nr:phosphopantetheine-binding protein [Oscillospiraceae bacterium]